MPLYDDLHAAEIAEHYSRHWQQHPLRCPVCGTAIRTEGEGRAVRPISEPVGRWIRTEAARDPTCPACCEECAESAPHPLIVELVRREMREAYAKEPKPLLPPGHTGPEIIVRVEHAPWEFRGYFTHGHLANLEWQEFEVPPE